MGSVRLIENYAPADPPGLAGLDRMPRGFAGFFQNRCSEPLRAHAPLNACQRPVKLVGTGGTATILARMETGMGDFDREQIESASLTSSRLPRPFEVILANDARPRQASPDSAPTAAM